ncbi:MAG TPA: hypothetical protein VHX17_04920 [Candidatus Cybelea sp.]|jgi:hypothetical protein|nr:hypothetical protein [Candidatus Cybelea sp.]
MRILTRIGGLTLAAALAAPAVASAALMPNMSNEPTRFSGSCCVYTGAPDLPLTLSMIVAGGGPKSFQTVTLLKVLTGKLFDAEVGKLTKQYGKAQIGQFLTTFDFVVSDSLRIVTEKKVALPSKPDPDPSNGPALAAALWKAGQSGQGFNVEVMLDRLVSHPIHIQVMKDIDAKYGLGVDAQYHAILTTAMKDLAGAYKLSM